MPTAIEAKPLKRTVEMMLEEVIQNTREQLRRENVRLEGYREKDLRLDEMMEFMRSSFTGLANGKNSLRFLLRWRLKGAS